VLFHWITSVSRRTIEHGVCRVDPVVLKWHRSIVVRFMIFYFSAEEK